MTIVLNGLDDAWREANEIVDTLPDEIIEPNLENMQTLLTHHAQHLQQRLDKAAGGKSPVHDYLTKTIQIAEAGNIREGLRRLTIGLLEKLPAEGTGHLERKFTEAIGADTGDKAVILAMSLGKTCEGLIPAMQRIISMRNAGKSFEIDTFYSENFPSLKNEGIA